MEILQDSPPLEYKYRDVVILVKRHASAADKFFITMSGDMDGDKLQYKPSQFFQSLIKRFVVSWKGVTKGGQPVPYSYEALESLPGFPGENLFLSLGSFIIEHSDVMKSAFEIKNASGVQSAGSAKLGPLTASEKTARGSLERIV